MGVFVLGKAGRGWREGGGLVVKEGDSKEELREEVGVRCRRVMSRGGIWPIKGFDEMG